MRSTAQSASCEQTKRRQQKKSSSLKNGIFCRHFLLLFHLQSDAVCVACSNFILLGLCPTVTQRVVYFLSSHTTCHPHDLHPLTASGRAVRQTDGPCVGLQAQRARRVGRVSQRWLEAHWSQRQHWFPEVGVKCALIQSVAERNDMHLIGIILCGRPAIPVTPLCQIIFDEIIHPTTLINGNACLVKADALAVDTVGW